MYHDSFAARNKAFYTTKLPRKGEGRTESYTYDANGNRATKTTASVTITDSYDAENLLQKTCGVAVYVEYTYGSNGGQLVEEFLSFLLCLQRYRFL